MGNFNVKRLSIVTGGTSGLGLSLVKQLLNKNNDILIVSRNKERFKIFKGFSGKVHFVCGDISKKRTIYKVEKFVSKNGYIVEHLFNNAGIGYAESVFEINEITLNSVIGTNLKGLILLTSSVLRMALDDQELRIVNIMSTTALVGRKNESVYCASKWGVRGFTESLRLELNGTKKYVHGVYPGGIKTPWWENMDPKKDISNYLDADDVAKIIIDAIFSESIVSDIVINRK